MAGFLRKIKRKRVLAAPTPLGHLRILHQGSALYRRLPAADRAELLDHVKVFVAEKTFEGCAGLELTDEIRVTIAAGACLPLLHRRTDYYPMLYTILVYPTGYVAQDTRRPDHGVITEGDEPRLGEAWTSGVIVLSWQDVRANSADPETCRNVVLHEFAHQIDHEAGLDESLPLLDSSEESAAFARVLSHEYERLCRDARLGRATLLDDYGATNPHEFFAVATEAFFLQPEVLRLRHPELYQELTLFYLQDPAAWPPETALQP